MTIVAVVNPQLPGRAMHLKLAGRGLTVAGGNREARVVS